MAEQNPSNDMPNDDQAVQDALAEAQSTVNDIQDDLSTGSESTPEEGFSPMSLTEAPEGIELLNDVDLHVMIELGRTEMLVEDVLKLGQGSVVELDKLAGDPVDVHVNGRLVARGEVLVLNDNFCIRISEIIANLEEQAAAAAEESKMSA